MITGHLSSRQVSRVIYGAIIGLALVVALQAHPPPTGAVIATLLGTAVAVALAEVYSELVGFETVRRRHVTSAERESLTADAAAVAIGVGFPSVFFLLALVGVLDDEAAFTIARWSGLGLLGLYGFAGARLTGSNFLGALLKGGGVALIGAALIGLKALVH
jgi:multisubunit Na+/H+ antiporter MnhB subunit